jgi:dsDNA-binding SOS-regulon protein
MMLFGQFLVNAQSNKEIDYQSRVQKISVELEINKKKAEELVKVLNQYQQLIAQTMQDTIIKPKLRQEKLSILIKQQQQAVGSIITEQEQIKLNVLLNDKYKADRKQREEQIKNKTKLKLDKAKQ